MHRGGGTEGFSLGPLDRQNKALPFRKDLTLSLWRHSPVFCFNLTAIKYLGGMATTFDEKNAAAFEGTPIPKNEPPAPVPRINRTWSSGSYPRLSEFMGLWPEVAIFRRFGALNTQNLLFLQAEIAHLERELQIIREREEKREDERGLLAQRSWFELSQAMEDGAACPQWAVIQDIRSKLSEYSKRVTGSCLMSSSDV